MRLFKQTLHFLICVVTGIACAFLAGKWLTQPEIYYFVPFAAALAVPFVAKIVLFSTGALPAESKWQKWDGFMKTWAPPGSRWNALWDSAAVIPGIVTAYVLGWWHLPPWLTFSS